MPPPPSPDLALVDVAWNGDAECLQAVLDLGMADWEARDDTALMQAAWSGEAAAVRAVLGLGVRNKDLRDEDGQKVIEAS